MRYSKGLRREHKKTLQKREFLSGSTMICSFDLAKKKHAFHVLDGQRNVITRGSVPHSLEGMETLLERLEMLRTKVNCERIVFFMEGASYFWMPVISLLRRKGYQYRLVENKAVGHQRHLEGQSGRKNDTIDAAHIATLGSSLHFAFSQLSLDDKWISLRAYALEYQEMVDLITAEKNRIHAFLGTIFPKYYDIFHDPFKDTSLAVLSNIDAAYSLDVNDFVTCVRASFTRKNLLIRRSKAIWAYVRSDDPWGYVEARPALVKRIKAASERVKMFIKQQEQLRDLLLAVYRKIPYSSNLDSIPGSSSVENAVLLGIVGTPKDFDEARALVSMAGLDPGERSSGQYQGKTRITKAGKAHLRRAAISATMAVLKSRKNNDFVRRFFFLQQRANNPYKSLQALCACASKYLRTVWWLCTTNSFYQPQIAHYGFSKTEVKQLKQLTDEVIFEPINVESQIFPSEG